MKDVNQIEEQLRLLITERESHDFEKQVADAARVIGEIGKVDSDEAFRKVKKQMDEIQPAGKWIHYMIRIAASLFIPLLFVSGWMFFHNKTMDRQYCEQLISSPRGVRSQLVLPDGSRVWLGSESSIRFSVPFSKNSRKVALNGEAYFEVQKNKKIPFIVKAGNLAVTVTGTCFNVKAFDEDKTSEVVLEEGTVILKNQLQTERQKGIVMKPGERAVMDKSTGKMVIESVKTENFTGWRKGKLVFDETPMPEVALQLERWYGVRVTIRDPEINKYRITTTFENEPLDQVLELLRISSPIEIRYYPVTLNKNSLEESRAQIIISEKPEK